jgi:hypothetical protein
MWTGQITFYPTIAIIKIYIVLFNRRLTGLTSCKWMIFHNTLLCPLVPLRRDHNIDQRLYMHTISKRL